MRSSDSADRIALDRGLPTTAADVAALRRLGAPRPLDLEDYLRFLQALGAPSVDALRARRGPKGPPFALGIERPNLSDDLTHARWSTPEEDRTMTQPVTRDELVQATRDLPELRITEVVLQTAHWQEMKDWYSAFLGVEPYFETETMCFRRVSDKQNQLFVLFHFPELAERPAAVPGLNHVQFKCNTLAEALDRYERLKAVGITPQRSFNHGPGTSFYYRDPDGNTMEISGPNLATEAEYRAYFQTEAFRRNPRGVAIDPDEFVAKFRCGTPQPELVRIP